jgi:hypothetical protein
VHLSKNQFESFFALYSSDSLNVVKNKKTATNYVIINFMHAPLQIARLRLLVCLLGQRGAHAWWDTSFLTESGLETLEYNFPRAPKAAAFTATCGISKTTPALSWSR